jgi:MinD-like ATPase involved in chromosome partitioning or flagellar assembly
MTLVRSRRPGAISKPQPSLSTVIGIHGPAGSTGKTSLAFNLAYEFAELGKRVCLMDFDVHAPSLANHLGLSEPPIGLSGCARLIRQGRFNSEQFERLSVLVRHRRGSFRVLTGIPASRRWNEVSEDTVRQLVAFTRAEFEITLLDLSSPLEADLFSATCSSPRNGVTITSIRESDVVVSVVLQTPLSLARYLAQHLELQEINPRRQVVINRSNNQAAFSSAIRDLTKQEIFCRIPDDQPAFQLSESSNLPLALARRKSSARTSIALLAHKLLECQSLDS